MIQQILPIIGTRQSVRVNYDDGHLKIKVQNRTYHWQLEPARTRGPVENAQMNLPGVPRMGVYARMAHKATVCKTADERTA